MLISRERQGVSCGSVRTQALTSASWDRVPPESQATLCKGRPIVLHQENGGNGGTWFIVHCEKGSKLWLTRDMTNTTLLAVLFTADMTSGRSHTCSVPQLPHRKVEKVLVPAS